MAGYQSVAITASGIPHTIRPINKQTKCVDVIVFCIFFQTELNKRIVNIDYIDMVTEMQNSLVRIICRCCWCWLIFLLVRNHWRFPCIVTFYWRLKLSIINLRNTHSSLILIRWIHIPIARRLIHQLTVSRIN